MPSTLGITTSQAFTPYDLSPALWLDAADTTTITASSNLVSQWNDKSGNGRNVTQGTGANQPTTGVNTLNGRNVLTFDNKSLATTSLNVRTWFDPANWTNTTVIIAYRTSSTSEFYMALGAQGASFRLSVDLRSATNAKFYDMGDPSGGRLSGNDGTAADQSNIVVARRDGANIVVRRNKSQVLSMANASGTVGDTDSTSFTVGVTSGSFFRGTLGEVMVIPRALTDGEVSFVESYLSDKWGI